MEISKRTLVFLVDRKEDRVLLGLKKTGFGEGKILGVGGKVEFGETIADAACREVAEEINVSLLPSDLADSGIIKFRFPDKPKWDQDVYLFQIEKWLGSPTESAELKPHWTSIADLPLEKMWDDAKYWLPKLLAGEKIEATFTFNNDLETVKSVIWSI